jgi:hypothetical protein
LPLGDRTWSPSWCRSTPLFDRTWSDDIVAYQREEDGLLEQGDLRGAAILNVDFWLTSPVPRDRVIEMQEGAFELQGQSEAEEVSPETVDLAAITARALVVVRVRPTRLPGDRRAAGTRDPGCAPGRDRGRRPSARAGAAGGDGAARAGVPERLMKAFCRI